MGEYGVRFATSAANEFRSLPTHVKDRLATAIEELKNNPRPVGTRKLKGRRGLFRIRSGLYRLVYEVDDKKREIRVIRVHHRREVYR